MVRMLAAVAFGLLCCLRAGAAETHFDKWLSVKLELNGSTFWRGESYPVNKLKATLTLTNVSENNTPLVLPKPAINA